MSDFDKRKVVRKKLGDMYMCKQLGKTIAELKTMSVEDKRVFVRWIEHLIK